MVSLFSAKILSASKSGGIIMGIVLALFFNSCNNADKQGADHLAYIDKITDEANRMLDKGEGKKALAFFDSAFQVIYDPGIGDQIRRLTFEGQHYYPKTGDYHKAIVRLDSIFILLPTEDLKKKYIREYSIALFQKGDLLFKIKRYNDAYQYYYRGKIIAQTILDPCAVSEYTYRLGMVSYKQAKYEQAVDNFKQCFEDAAYCAKDFRNFATRQELLANIALSYGKYGKTDSSLIYSQKALDFLSSEAKGFDDHQVYIETAKAVVYGNQASQYYKKGDTLMAENLLKKSIAANVRKGFDIADGQISMVKLGELYVETKRFDQSYEVIRALKNSLDSSYNLFADMGFNKLNWKYYDQIQKPELAYISLQQYMLLKDSMERENRKLVSADVEREFQTIEQNYNYDMLMKANEVKKSYLYVALLFSVMGLAIVLLLLQIWRSSRRNVATLTNLNRQITFQNKQLEETLEDLRQSNDDKDKILKVVAHDLRNPLGAISTIASLLLDEVDFSEEHREFARIMKASSLHSIEMINDLLSANFNYRPEEMKKEVVDMKVLLDDCVEQLKFKADEKKQKIALDIRDNPLVFADRERLWRVLSNVIINAIKFSPEGSAIEVKVLEKDGKMELSVKDNGIGIPDALKDKVFDPFTNAKRWGTSGEQPFGLGLSISKQIIDAHGGTIWFESEESQGTTFYITLPVAGEKSENTRVPLQIV